MPFTNPLYIACDSDPSTCTDPSTTSPVQNISSEAQDTEDFFGRSYGTYDPPPLGSNFTAQWCLGQCVSSVSQEDADQCAQRAAILCVGDSGDPRWPTARPNPNPNPTPDTPPYIPGNQTIYYNTEQSADFVCPDGSVFTYTIPAGVYSAFTQAAADNIANSVATTRAAERHICIGELSPDSACLGDDYEATVTVTSGAPLASILMTDGELPPGLTIDLGDTSFTISGTASGVGGYIFSILVEDTYGGFMEKEFTIRVATIANQTLPDGVLSVPYTPALAVDGTTNPTVVWSVVSGSLPTGVSLASNGQFSGSPTANGVFTFTVQMEDDQP